MKQVDDRIAIKQHHDCGGFYYANLKDCIKNRSPRCGVFYVYAYILADFEAYVLFKKKVLDKLISINYNTHIRLTNIHL